MMSTRPLAAFDERDLALLRMAGLEQTARQFPDDLALALKSAASMRAALSGPDDPRAEPWPPMQMKDTRCIS